MGLGKLPDNKNGSYQEILEPSGSSLMESHGAVIGSGTAEFRIQDVFCSAGGTPALLSHAHLPRALLAVCFSYTLATVPSPHGWRQAEMRADAGLLLGSSLGPQELSPLPPPCASAMVQVWTWQTTSGSWARLNTSPCSSPSACPGWWGLAAAVLQGWSRWLVSLGACGASHLLLLQAG